MTVAVEMDDGKNRVVDKTISILQSCYVSCRRRIGTVPCLVEYQPANNRCFLGFYSPEAFSVIGLRLSFVIFGFSVLQMM
jgi:hypothetical protein